MSDKLATWLYTDQINLSFAVGQDGATSFETGQRIDAFASSDFSVFDSAFNLSAPSILPGFTITANASAPPVAVVELSALGLLPNKWPRI